MKKNILPITILLASIILGGFYYATQLNKQASIERQQRIKLGAEKKERLAKKTAKEEEIKIRKECKESARQVAIRGAGNNFTDKTIKAQAVWEIYNDLYIDCLEKNSLKKLN